MTDAFLGIDLGTSGVKVAILAGDGRTLATATREYVVSSPAPGAAESDPGDWWRATVTAVREALASSSRGAQLRVHAVGLSGQMHGTVLTSEVLAPVRPALTWADSRARGQLERWRVLPAEVRAALANPLVPGMTGPQLAWLQATEPDAVRSARWVLLPKDWLRAQLTGTVATEPSDASATLLWDLPGDAWSEAALEAAGVSLEVLPPLIGSAEPAGSLAPDAAGALGLPAGIPVAAGAADTAAALLGSGLGVGETLLTVGTGAQVLQLRTVAAPARDPVTHLYRAATARQWYAMAAVQNAGLAWSWVRRGLDADWDELYASLDAPLRASDPVLVPYLTGERTPVLDHTARATWTGLSIEHGRQELLRSALVGVACALRHAYEALLTTSPAPPEVVKLAGGGTRDARVRQLLADMLGVVVLPLDVADASVRGAAMLAARAAGHELPDARRGSTRSTIVPGPVAVTAHDLYERYLDAVSVERRDVGATA